MHRDSSNREKIVSALSIKHVVTEKGHVDKTQVGSLSLASPFGVRHFGILGFEESKDLTLLHFELLTCEIIICPRLSDQGRLIAIDLPLEGDFGDFGVPGT